MPFRKLIEGVNHGPTEDDIRRVIDEMNVHGEPHMEDQHGWCFCHTTATLKNLRRRNIAHPHSTCRNECYRPGHVKKAAR